MSRKLWIPVFAAALLAGPALAGTTVKSSKSNQSDRGAASAGPADAARAINDARGGNYKTGTAPQPGKRINLNSSKSN